MQFFIRLAHKLAYRFKGRYTPLAIIATILLIILLSVLAIKDFDDKQELQKYNNPENAANYDIYMFTPPAEFPNNLEGGVWTRFRDDGKTDGFILNHDGTGAYFVGDSVNIRSGTWSLHEMDDVTILKWNISNRVCGELVSSVQEDSEWVLSEHPRARYLLYVWKEDRPHPDVYALVSE